MHFLRLSGLFVLMLCSCFSANAQKLLEESLREESAYTAQHWRTEEGLPQNSVLSVTRVKSGNIWILTYSGISSFDGRKFITYNEANVPLLKGLFLTGTSSDHTGSPVLFTSKGSFILNASGTGFQPWKIGSSNVIGDARSENGDLYLATYDGNVFRKTGQGKPVKLFSVNSSIHNILYSSGKVVVTGSRGLFIYTGDSLRRVRLGDDSDLACSFPVWQSMYSGRMAATTRQVTGMCRVDNDRICVYRNCDNSAIYYVSLSTGHVTAVKVDLDGGAILDLTFDTHNKVTWIATNKGVYYCPAGFTQFTRIPFINDECYSLDTDLENNTWIGTKSGLYLLKPKLFHTYNRTDGLVPDGIGGILETAPDEITICNSDCGGIYQMKKGVISRMPYPELQGICGWSLLKTSSGVLYIGAGQGKLFSIRNGKCSRIPLPDECRDVAVLSLYEDSQGVLWIGTGAGLFTKAPDDNVKAYKDFTIKGMVIQIFCDSRSRLWIGSSSQLCMRENGKWKDFSPSTGLKVNYVRAIYEDRDANIWIGTRGEGLLRFYQDKFTRYAGKFNLLDNDVWSIAEDRAGMLWMSSNQGITVASRSDLLAFDQRQDKTVRVRHFDRTDGMISSEFNGGFMPAVINASDGRLWFPGAKGLSVVDPRKVDFSPFAIPTSVEKMVVDGNEVEIQRQVNIKTGNEPARIQFFYTAPVFGHRQDVVFQTRLEGYDVNWSDPTAARMKEYQNLPPGNYKFRVKVYGSTNGNQSGESIVLLSVPGPLWKELWFILAISVISVIGVAAVFLLRIRSIRKKNEKQQQLQKQFAALELKALQSQMNPHFIFNCLNSIKYFIAVHDEVSAGKYLQSFSKLLRRFLEQSDQSTISLFEERELLSLYIELQQMRFTRQFTYAFNTTGIDARKIRIPTMLLQPFVENAIIHGLMPLDDPGQLLISFEQIGNALQCEIRDDGVGRKKAGEKKKSMDRSMGISITESRIELLNYFNGNSISFETFDTYSDGRENSGTTVRILIPINTDQHA
ncbi:MAG: histidine kinase [Bacteroidota bacterium]